MARSTWRSPVALLCWGTFTLLVSPAEVSAFPPVRPQPPPLALQTRQLTNKTNSVATDLHVNVPGGVAGNPSATSPQFPNEGPFVPNGFDLSGGLLSSGSTATVNWQSFSPHDLDPKNPGFWTLNNTNIGPITVADAAPIYQQNPDGSWNVNLDNETGAPLSYSNLQIYSNADSAFFSPSNYLNGMTTGSPVALLIPSSGTFAEGLTQVATVDLPATPALYDAGSVQLDGLLLGAGFQAVPEPSSIVLMILGAGFVAFQAAGRARRAKQCP